MPCRYLYPDSEGGSCDILAYAPQVASRSSWSTIASPRFNIYEKDRSCDNLNTLNLDDEVRGRILTGKNPIVNIDAATEEFLGQSQVLPRPMPTFAGFTGNSFYQVQPVNRPYSRPPVRPANQDLQPFFVSSMIPQRPSLRPSLRPPFRPSRRPPLLRPSQGPFRPTNVPLRPIISAPHPLKVPLFSARPVEVLPTRPIYTIEATKKIEIDSFVHSAKLVVGEGKR
jgi:hypothetical protein